MLRTRKLVTSLRGLIPLSVVPAVRTAYHLAFRMQLQLRCRMADILDRARANDHKLPPAMLRFRVSGLIDTRDFYRIGSGCARLIEESLQTAGKTIAPGVRILDFGCGCGRTLRWLLLRHPNSEFHGVDVDLEAIKWCTKHLKPGRFQATSPFPPLPFPNNHFDIVYSISVFTHLDECMQDVWLSELSRVLKPDGVLVLTVHGTLAAQELDPDAREVLKRSGFLHRHSMKLKGLVPDWYNTTWHSEEYILARLSRWFLNTRYQRVPDGMQDVVVAWSQSQRLLYPSQLSPAFIFICVDV